MSKSEAYIDTVGSGAPPAKPAAPSKGSLPRDEWVESFEGWADCDKCRAPVLVVRENAARYWNSESERKFATTRHRLFYTCEECGHEASRLVDAKPVPASNPRRWDIGAPGDWAAYRALSAEVSRWHRLGLVETRVNLHGQKRRMTSMSAEVWIEAGCPPSWSPVWDEINKDYPKACYENCVKEFCDIWRVKLENGREKRMEVRAAS